MFDRKELTALRLRKQALLLESQMNRLALCLEYQQWRAAGGLAGRARETWHQFRPWAVLLAPVAGLLLVVGLRSRPKTPGSLFKWAAAIPSLLRWWRLLSGLFKRPTSS